MKLKDYTRHKTNPFPKNLASFEDSYPKDTLELFSKLSKPAMSLMLGALDRAENNMATLERGDMKANAYYKAVVELLDLHAVAIAQLPFVYLNPKYVRNERSTVPTITTGDLVLKTATLPFKNPYTNAIGETITQS